MKRIIITILLAIFATPLATFGHPGNTAADGCHYCRTNCDYWGVSWNERHCHVSQVAPAISLPISGSDIVPAAPPLEVVTPLLVAAKKAFVGIPKTKEQLLLCPVVANKKSKIYHLKGSKYIKTMTVKDKRCYATEKEAKKAGYRKAK